MIAGGVPVFAPLIVAGGAACQLPSDPSLLIFAYQTALTAPASVAASASAARMIRAASSRASPTIASARAWSCAAWSRIAAASARILAAAPVMSSALAESASGVVVSGAEPVSWVMRRRAGRSKTTLRGAARTV